MSLNDELAAQKFKALSDSTRLKILFMLSKEELCACKILDEFNITQPTLSYHMKMLVDSGLVKSYKSGSWVRYSINNRTINLLIEYVCNFNSYKDVEDVR